MADTMRIVKLVVIPFVVIDDGEHLHEVDVKPLEVASGQVDEFVNGGLAEALDKLSEQFVNP